MENIETTSKFYRLKSISSKVLKIIVLLLWQLICFQESLYNYKGKISSFIVKKIFIDIEFKEVLIICFWLSLYNYQEKL